VRVGNKSACPPVVRTAAPPRHQPPTHEPPHMAAPAKPTPPAHALGNLSDLTNNPTVAILATPIHYTARMAALQRLPQILSTNDATALVQWLTNPYDPACGLTSQEYNGLKNAAADLLLRQPEVPPAWVSSFATMFRDASYDPVWRDYCLQYLAIGQERVFGRTEPEAVTTQALALEVLREATSQRTASFAGTALLGLQAIARRNPEVMPTSEVATLATAVAKDDRSSEPCRITALRVAALQGAKEVLPVARELAQTGETEMLRMVAIVSIGELGSAADQELLDALTHDGEPHVAGIATQAAATIKKRVEQTR
jgi:hypothetical protein